MSYTLIVEKVALKVLKKLSTNLKQRINSKLSELAEDPFAEHLNVKALAGRENEFRLRVGDRRVIYELHRDRLVIRVLTIAPRRGRIPTMTLKTIEENGARYVLVPESDYQHYLEAMEDLEDIRAADEAKREMTENGWQGIRMEFLRPALDGKMSYLQAFRMDREMTQQQLAEASGVDRTTITRLEANTRTGTIDHWKKLAEALHTDIESLLP